MIKFLMNLFNIGKEKKEDEMQIEVDKDNRIIKVTSNKELSFDEIISIAKEYLDE